MKIETKMVHYVEYRDLEEFVVLEYGRELEFVADQECGNDTSQEFWVTAEPLPLWDGELIEQWRTGGDPGWVTGAVLNDLCVKGKIPAGEYIVRVSW